VSGDKNSYPKKRQVLGGIRRMKIALACDHGGFALKEEIKKFLLSEKLEVLDLGTNSEESVDYPIYGKLCAEAVASGKADRGIVCCGTGIGISIAANKVMGIRCALCTDTHMAEMTRKHNDSNMLALGGRTVSVDVALEISKTWLYTEFEGGRHKRRVDMLDEM
jgi:ribose 5-phosphate isomerase B